MMRNGRADDADPSPWAWPRSWAAASVVIALVAALLGWQGGRSRRDDSAAARGTGSAVASATAAVTATPTPTTRPSGFAGEAIGSVAGVELVLGGGRPSVVSLSNGGATELTGLPPDALVGQLLRVHGLTLALAGRDAPGPPAWAVYAIADGTATARRLPGSAGAGGLAPGATAMTFWVLAAAGGRGQWQERDLSGRLLTTPVMSPDWALVRGVVGGLLVQASSDGVSTDVFVWDPARRRRMRSFPTAASIVAATSTHLAWTADDGCVSEGGGCRVHVTDLRDSADGLIALPEHAGDPWGALSPDGTMLALVLVSPDHDSTAETYIGTIADAAVTRVEGATYATLQNTPLLVWTDDSRALFLGAATEQRLTLAVLAADDTLKVLRKDFPPAYEFAVRPTS
jgi:hypothetical protein